MTDAPTWDAMTPEELYGLLLEGRSYGQIATVFNVTRNTVSGRVHRWKQAGKFPGELPNQTKPSKAKPAKPEPAFPKVKHKTNVNLPTVPPAEHDPDNHKGRPTAITPPTNDPVSVLDLERDMCAVVVSMEPILYCGCKPLKNHKFRMCAYHASTMVDIPARRKEAREVALRSIKR